MDGGEFAAPPSVWFCASQLVRGLQRVNSRSPSAGFTYVELVVAIAVAGVLFAVVGPRFVGPDAFRSRGFYDEAQGVVRFAQKLAVARRGTIFVCVSATAVTAATDVGCAAPVSHPATGAALTTTAPNGVTLSAANFSFDSAGRPIPDAQVTVVVSSTVAGDPARQIVVERETGYVHP